MSCSNPIAHPQPFTHQLADDTASTLAGQAARRLAIRQAETQLQDCLALGEFLDRFQRDMLNSDLHRPWSVERYAAIEKAELHLSAVTAGVMDRLRALQQAS